MTTKYELRVTGEFKQNLKLCQKRGLLVHHEIDGVKTHEGVRREFINMIDTLVFPQRG